MKLKLFGLAALAAGMLSSCVTEDLEGPGSYSPAAFSIRLSSIPVETKATYGTDIDYEYATKDELHVDRCAIAIFHVDEDNEPGELKMYAYATTAAQTLRPTTTSDTPNDTLAYEYTFEDLLESNEPVHILVIANIPEATVNQQIFGNMSPKDLDLSTIHYSDFMRIAIHTDFPSTYDAKTLIKMGEYRTVLDRYHRVTEIPMTQLAARVDFNVKVTIPPLFTSTGGAVSEMDMVDLSHWNKDLQSIHNRAEAKTEKSYIVHYDNQGNVIDTLIVWNCKSSDHDLMDITLNGVTYPHDNGWKFAYVDGLRVDSVKVNKQWVMLLNAVKVFNIQPESFLISESDDQGNNTWERTYGTPVLITNNHVERFYTYRKSLELEANSPVTVQLNASLALVTITDSLHYNVSGHGLWVKKKSNEKGLDSGWGMNDGVFVFIQDSKKPPVFSWSTSTKEYERINPANTYQTTISANGNQKLESGWFYNINATVGAEYLPPNLPAEQQPPVATKAAASANEYGILFEHSSMPWGRK